MSKKYRVDILECPLPNIASCLSAESSLSCSSHVQCQALLALDPSIADQLHSMLTMHRLRFVMFRETRIQKTLPGALASCHCINKSVNQGLYWTTARIVLTPTNACTSIAGSIFRQGHHRCRFLSAAASTILALRSAVAWVL